MTKGKASGIALTTSDLPIVLGMDNRGDRNHDIAAWFGVNQGRIAEVKAGEYGTVVAASGATLPPKGSPGLKGRALRASVQIVHDKLVDINDSSLAEILKKLSTAIAAYDRNEM